MNNLLLLVIFMASLGLGNSINDPIVFNLTQTNYSVYEDEYITICLDGPSSTELTTLSGSSLELEVVDGWSNFSRSNREIDVGVGNHCFHLKANSSNAISDVQYTTRLSSVNEDILLPGDFNITVKKKDGAGIKLGKNNLYIKGIDSSIDNEGTDKIILGNSVPIPPFTSFSISSTQSTPTGSDIAASYNFMYTGDHDMDDNGIFCILISDQGYQAFGDIPNIDISFNGQDFTPFFSITNALPNPTSSSFIPSDEPNIIAVNQGDYYVNALSETSFIGNTTSSIGINLNNGSLGGGNNLGPDTEFDPNGDFCAIFICDGNLYFCDLATLFANEALWTFDEGGSGRDDFDAQTCIDFCSIIDNDCSGIEYELNVVDCQLVFNISNCSILEDSDVKWYYKPSSECGSSGGWNEIVDANFTIIKDSPTSAEISLPIPYNTGCYMIEVYCEECLSPIVKEFEVDECCPFAHEISTFDATCNPTGGINLEILGVGIPPFSFLWNTGATSEDLGMIDEGVYTVTVTDLNGCMDEFSANVGSCCCEYTLDFGGAGLEIADIYVNDSWLSDNTLFTFPYDNDGETSTGANLQDLVYHLNIYEGPEGNAYLQNGSIVVESCNVYKYIIGNDQYAKNDDCENTDVMTVTNSCENVIDYECNLMFDLISNGDCSLDIIISQNSNYLVTLEYRAPNTNVWVPVVSNLSYSTNIGYAATGFYRLIGVGIGVCKDVVACEIDHICCECDIANVELLGDYLEDEELCLGIDSLGFRVTTQNCQNSTDVELTLPDGTTQTLVEVADDVYEIMISTAPDENDNGLYTFNAVDSYNCFDTEEIDIEIENCELCANCELLMPITSYTPGKINIYDLTTSCGLIDSFEITWYLDEVEEQNILFKTGTSDDVFNHPLTNFPVQGGTIIPVLDWISINGAYYDNQYPGIGMCLDSVFVETPDCGSAYYTQYNYTNGGFPDRIIDFKVSSNTNYIKVSFKGYTVNDTIKVLSNNEVLFYAAIGQDVDVTDYNSSPNKIKTQYLVPYLIDVNDIEFDADSTLRIEIYANKLQPSTKWNFSIQCIDDYECGELGAPDYENVTCSFDSSFCYYSFNLPHIGTVAPQNLPYDYTYKLQTGFNVSKSICSYSIDYNFLSPDYCEQDSIEIAANSTLGNYTLTFHGTGNFYSEIKTQLESLLSNYAADCEYTGDISYYKKLRLALSSGTTCIDQDTGDGSNSQYQLVFQIHPCIENIDFLDAEKKMVFHKNPIINYQANDCDECKSFIQSFYINSVNIPVNESSANLDKIFYQLHIVNYSFKYIPSENLVNYSDRYRYINYYDYASEICPSDPCKSQQYRLIIDDLDDGCNNFSIYADPTPCEHPALFDSLVYQISNGIETYIDNAEMAKQFRDTDLATIIETHAVYESDARVYPNPAYQSVNIEYTTNIDNGINIEIYDKSMKLVRKFGWDVSRGTTKQTLDISALPAGLYIVRFQEDNKSIYKRFVAIR